MIQVNKQEPSAYMYQEPSAYMYQELPAYTIKNPESFASQANY